MLGLAQAAQRDATVYALLGVTARAALRYLGRADRRRNAAAIEALRSGVDGLPPEMRRADRVGEYVHQLVMAHVQDHDAESARTAVEEAAEIASVTGSARLAGQVERLMRRLGD